MNLTNHELAINDSNKSRKDTTVSTNLRASHDTDERIPKLVVQRNGTVKLGPIKYRPLEDTLRSDILKLIGETNCGILCKIVCQRELIEGFLKRQSPHAVQPFLITSRYIRRRSNVAKAISRLRTDLEKKFKDHFPEGTQWLCHSEKIGGWLLYRLPGLGCDGEYHW